MCPCWLLLTNRYNGRTFPCLLMDNRQRFRATSIPPFTRAPFLHTQSFPERENFPSLLHHH
jgi:hypothetical protein